MRMKIRKYKILIIVCMLIGVGASLVFYRLFEVRVQKIPRWSIGRYHLDSLLTVNDPGDNPIFSARSFVGGEAMFVADPYVFSGSDSLYLFYEVGIKRSRSGWGGDIALATSVLSSIDCRIETLKFDS